MVLKLASFTAAQVYMAYRSGEKVWLLSTGSAGEDDTLIGEETDVRIDILNYHEIDEWPEGWTLDAMEAGLTEWELGDDPVFMAGDHCEGVASDGIFTIGYVNGYASIWTANARTLNTNEHFTFCDPFTSFPAQENGWYFIADGQRRWILRV